MRTAKPLKVPGIVPKLSATPGSTRWLGPALGEHTDSILAALGYGAGDIAALRAEGAVARTGARARQCGGLAQAETDRNQGLPGRVRRQAAQRPGSAQRRLVEQGWPLLCSEAGGDGIAGFVQDQENQGFALLAAGNRLFRIEEPRIVELL